MTLCQLDEPCQPPVGSFPHALQIEEVAADYGSVGGARLSGLPVQRFARSNRVQRSQIVDGHSRSQSVLALWRAGPDLRLLCSPLFALAGVSTQLGPRQILGD